MFEFEIQTRDGLVKFIAVPSERPGFSRVYRLASSDQEHMNVLAATYGDEAL